MKTVQTLKEAEKWFLSHSEGQVMCQIDERTLVVDNYIDAEEFFSPQ